MKMGLGLKLFVLSWLLSSSLTTLLAQVVTPTWTVPPALAELLEYEQTRIDRTVNPELIMPPTIKGQREDLRPESRSWFRLKSVWLPESILHVAQLTDSAFSSTKFIKTINGERHFLLFIHPESENFYKDLMKKYPKGQDYFATSTSSSRTVLTTDGKGTFFFAKLSLDVELGGVVRTIPRGEVARSVGTSQYIDAIQSGRDGAFLFMREGLGIIPKDRERGGQILREIPPAMLENKLRLVPLFSLYADTGEGPTLLEEMIKESKQAPEQFIKTKILAPFARAWSDWALKGGLVMEAHAQNVLLELDSKGKPTGRFYHRDMGGFNLALEQIGVKAGELPAFTSLHEDYHQKFTEKAMDQSLRVYFEGGFLFNIERLLLKLSPSYRQGSVTAQFRTMVAQELNRQSNGKIQVRNTQEIYRHLAQDITSARQARGAGMIHHCLTVLRGLF